MTEITPELKIRSVVDWCAGCDVCRTLLDVSCPFFPEMYKLWDKEQETGEEITPQELRNLVDLCNYCALCPCPNTREDIITAKTLFIDRDGLAPYIRTLEDVERVGKLCGAFPRLSNFLFQNNLTGGLIKKSAGIHAKRKLPLFPNKNFPSWVKQEKLHEKPAPGDQRKVAYFAGCTARYLFPDPPRAAVEVLQRNGLSVFYPEQNCCGMPSMLEGNRTLTLSMAEKTVSHLAEVVSEGYEIVCSCPTCGYMLKYALREGAYYSEEYQDLVGGDEKHLLAPATLYTKGINSEKTDWRPKEFRRSRCDGLIMSRAALQVEHVADGSITEMDFFVLNKTFFGKILKDDGYFSVLDPLKRIQVAENTCDLGEYLLKMYQRDELVTQLGPVDGRLVYYPPCHLREQGIETPYLNLLNLIPDISLESFPGTIDCCGMAGIMGFKQNFHQASLQTGSRLMAKIKRLNPDLLTTDCLSCRLQFNQMSSYPVQHPIEILNRSYESYQVTA